ncbi:MAG TPA: type VI secretion system tube protein Hcp [Nitrosospira sp.]|jgi:type VI secretion system secreted protein Hcp|nr:type VI secretion system tube protein Hcp [Nitrosospira sp.]
MAAQGDMFLKIETAKQGPIKGEAQDDNHKDEIDVQDWSWGMEAKTALSGGGTSPKATLNELSIIKQVDSASTGLMSAMRNNDLIKKAVLTVRKAGGNPHEFFKISIENGRITALDVDTTSFTATGQLSERLSLAFQKINVEYVPQGPEGLPKGSMLFDAEIS